MTGSEDDQPDLISDLSDLDFVCHLLADFHDDLRGKIGRFRMLTDLGGQMGPSGTMIFGGHAAYRAWVEARSSFVHGNYMATILLCQGLVEHLLAAYLHAGLMVDDIPDRIQFADTLRRCREREVISDSDVTDLRRMMALRNPLSHFRHLDDSSNLDRRSMSESEPAEDLLRHDAIFSIALAVRMLSMPAFRLG
ncbi:hypothetical protein FKB34_16280 [Glycocaulis profundi]|nr:hypothetical protein FKB34_16280 [Glycocaulis profundi]